MREIKFRAKERSGEWHVGSLFIEDGMGIPYIVSGVNTHYETNYLTVEVVSKTVGQYTGLKDSTGKEIYEGDILSLREGSDEMIKVIDFYAAITALDLSEMMNLRLLDYYFERGEVHVIGNVYDNPELLEDKR